MEAPWPAFGGDFGSDFAQSDTSGKPWGIGDISLPKTLDRFAADACALAVLCVVLVPAQSSSYGVSDGDPSCIIGGVC